MILTKERRSEKCTVCILGKECSISELCLATQLEDIWFNHFDNLYLRAYSSRYALDSLSHMSVTNDELIKLLYRLT